MVVGRIYAGESKKERKIIEWQDRKKAPNRILRLPVICWPKVVGYYSRFWSLKLHSQAGVTASGNNGVTSRK